jgi:hypothetical protein
MPFGQPRLLCETIPKCDSPGWETLVRLVARDPELAAAVAVASG